MSVIDNLTKKVTETAKAAAKKSGDIVEVTKLNMSINAEEEKIKKIYYDIGKAVHEAFSRGEELPDYLTFFCEKIRTIEESIEEMRQKVLELRNVKECPSCRTELDIDMAFCYKCGLRQESNKEKCAAENQEA